MSDEIIYQTDIKEYAEDEPVTITRINEGGRLVIHALNEGGHNCTLVDLVDVLRWTKKNFPYLFKCCDEKFYDRKVSE